MGSSQSVEVGKILTAIDGLGYTLTGDNFDFDAVPSSIQDKAYRFTIETVDIQELSGKRVEKDKSMNIWVAYRLTAGGDHRAAVLAMLDSAEAVEDALMKSLLTLPSLVMKTNMSKYVQNYIVFNISFNFTYPRDL